MVSSLDHPFIHHHHNLKAIKSRSLESSDTQTHMRTGYKTNANILKTNIIIKEDIFVTINKTFHSPTRTCTSTLKCKLKIGHMSN